MPLQENHKQYTAFIVPDGPFEFNVLPFGLANSPAAYQRSIQEALKALTNEGVIIYIDDILIPGPTVETCLERFEKTLLALDKSKFTLNLSKCQFLQTEISYLGYLVDGNGYGPLPGKVDAIRNIQPPTDKSGIKRILGLMGYYRNFIPPFAETCIPISTLLKKDTTFIWTERQSQALQELKEALSQATANHHFDPGLPTIVDTDASRFAIGVALQQIQDNTFRPIAFASRTFTTTEQNWSTREQEAYAII